MRAEGPLLVALDDPDPEIRIRAAVGLERLGVPATLVDMIERGGAARPKRWRCWSSSPAPARASCWPSCCCIRRTRCGPRWSAPSAAPRRRDLAAELIETARRDADPGLRAAAFETLGALGVREVLPAALDGLSDADEAVRTAAIGVLGTLGGPEVTARLRERTADPEAGVRTAAARALGLLRAPDAAPEFLRLLADPRSGRARGRRARRRRGPGRGAGARADRPPGRRLARGPASRRGRPRAPRGRGRGPRARARVRRRRLGDARGHRRRGEPPRCRQGARDWWTCWSRAAIPPGSWARYAPWATSPPPPPPPRSSGSGRIPSRPCARRPSRRWDGWADSASGAVAAAMHDPDETVRAAALDAASRLQLAEQGENVLALLGMTPRRACASGPPSPSACCACRAARRRC